MAKGSFDPGSSSVVLAILAGAVAFLGVGSGRRLLGLELYENERYVYILVIAIIAVTLGVMSVRHAQRHQQERQRERNQGVQTVDGDFALYLRPFFTDGKLPISNASRSTYPLALSHYTEERVVDLEFQIARASDAIFPLRAIGGGSIGAGKIETEDEVWQQTFQAQACQARLIFVVPLDQPGTRWEVRWLKEHGQFRKTVFVMPPNIIEENLNMDELWTQARNALIEDGVTLPAFQRQGMVFLLDDQGALEREASKQGLVNEALQDLILRLTDRRRLSNQTIGTSILVAVGCGLLWALAMIWMEEIPNLISWDATGLVLAVGASALSVFTVWTDFTFTHALRMVYHWWLAFFAGILGIVLWDEFTGRSLPLSQEPILASLIASFWGGYAWAGIIRRGDALMSSKNFHFMAWAWILPVWLTVPATAILWPEGVLPVGWGLSATIGVVMTLRIVCASGAVHPHSKG